MSHYNCCTRALDRAVNDADRSHMYNELCKLGRFTGNEYQ